ncbi:MAG: hypothetical protein FJZ90_18045 [Chloroflexi bacterium]|nr:hypothetical protein [Chloroflexota bacterium]
MTVMENLQLGLQVTGVGMALVFLTLIIVMIAIWLLDRLFRPKAEMQPAMAPVIAPAAAVPAMPGGPRAVKMDDEVAAIAVAIALQRARDALQRKTPAYDQELPPEKVTVVTIDPGPGTWRGHGRVKAMQ